MLIIFGVRSFAKTLAMLTLVCRRCHNPAAHRLVKRSRWFTLFFIPLVPLGITRHTVCAFCGVAQKVSKADAQRMLRTAQSATTAAPVPSGVVVPAQP
jgi:hypothetical protein